MTVFRNGTVGHKLYLGVLRSAKFFDSPDPDSAVKRIKYMAILPAGEYPSLLSPEYLEFLKKSHRKVQSIEVLEGILKKKNPPSPGLLRLFMRGKERLYCTMPFIHID